MAIETTEHRQVWRNGSAAPVRYPLGAFKVEVPPGAELVWYAYERASDPFTRTVDRQKLWAMIAPFAVIALLLLFGLAVVAYMITHASSGG